jgi:prephenate dehydrogenase
VLGIVGTGLIGGSIGLRTRKNGTRVIGYDADPAAAAQARARGAVDGIASRDALYRTCETIVIATPLSAACTELERLRGCEASWHLLVDVASVKRPILKAAQGVANFCATHPLAGNEGSGPSAAAAELFEGRTWAYVPTGSAELDGRVRAFVEGLGARPRAVGAAEHDRAVAVTSHLPQMIAWLLAAKIRAGGELSEALCGPAGREVLRLGRSPREVWRDVLAANADAIGSAGAALSEELAAECGAVDGGNGP